MRARCFRTSARSIGFPQFELLRRTAPGRPTVPRARRSFTAREYSCYDGGVINSNSHSEWALQLLRRVAPFRFLRDETKRTLVPLLHRHEFQPEECICRQNDRSDTVYLLADGEAEVVDPRRGVDDVVTVITPGHYFGEWEAIFHVPRVYGIRARTAVQCAALAGDEFRRLLRESAAFALAFGTILRDNQGIFAAFDRFKAALAHGADAGHIEIETLLPLYRALEPALHPLCADLHRIDGAALMYAVRRLPENVTRVFALLLLDELPAWYADADRLFDAVPTVARRREVWELLPGKNLVLLRSGDSDLMDLVSCLCLYATEARKIRERLTRESERLNFERLLKSAATDNPQSPAEQRDFLLTLPFSAREVDALLNVWPSDAVCRVADIARHREVFSVDIRRRERNYTTRRIDAWTAEVAYQFEAQMGIEPAALPSDVEVHIISSNTHSVTNCLNPWFDEAAERIEGWGRAAGHSAFEGAWFVERDRIYAAARDYLIAHPDERASAEAAAQRAGRFDLRHTASTGIQVQCIDLRRAAGAPIDPHLTAPSSDRRAVIVNIDHAFGQQAEFVIRMLLMLFGHNVRSAAFLGKAGALVGRRGDVLVPTAFIAQDTDRFEPVPHAEDNTDIDLLRARLGGREVHHGPMLTVDGTLLQNRQMLTFYRGIWDVVGMEMEGTHYFGQITEARQLGVVRNALDVRFYYYVSDLPLDSHDTLSARMAQSEGVPPLYATTRHVIERIIKGE